MAGTTKMAGRGPLLEVENLVTEFASDAGPVRAVDGVSFAVGAGETLAIVGESGSGKSVTSLSIMRLLNRRRARTEGKVALGGSDLLSLTDNEMRRIRGRRMAMIFQEPMTSLNPVFTIGRQIVETLEIHAGLKGKAAADRAVEMLDLVGIPDPQRRFADYPHRLSGGMRQRVMIAIALSCQPELLIADEPTTALDVTIQAQILDLMRRLQQEFGMSILFITHDLGVVAEMADRVAVMYAGRIVEEGNVRDVFHRPSMPYTRALLASVPRPALRGDGRRLGAIPGNVPSPRDLPPGCTFEPRCSFAAPACRVGRPPLVPVGEAHAVRCVRWNELDQAEASQ